jgi:hypothetical protein
MTRDTLIDDIVAHRGQQEENEMSLLQNDSARKKHPPRSVGFKRAMEAMRKHGTRLVRMHSNASPDGFAHYVIPGGYVEPDVAEKIKRHPSVTAGEDGLFPGCDQTWRMGS